MVLLGSFACALLVEVSQGQPVILAEILQPINMNSGSLGISSWDTFGMDYDGRLFDNKIVQVFTCVANGRLELTSPKPFQTSGDFTKATGVLPPQIHPMTI